MKFLTGRCAMVAASLAANAMAWGSGDSSAVTGAEELTPLTFQQFIKSSEVVMIDFYAPWCGHCQRFAPKFDTAAKKIAEANLNAKLGKVDCTAHQGYCNEKGIRGYPTMKIYKKGEELYHEYTGPRRVSSLVEFVEKQTLPVVTKISSTHGLNEFLQKEKSEVVLIGYIDENDEASKKVFDAAAEKLHEDFPLAVVTDPQVIKTKGVAKTPSVILYEPWEEGNLVHDGAFDVEAIKKFAKNSYTPLVGELNGDTFSMYTSNTPAGFLFVKTDEELKEWTAKLKPLAKTHKIRIAISNADDFAGFASFLAISDNGFPSFAIFEPATKNKYSLQETAGSLKVGNIAHLVDQYVGGKLSPTIRSQPVPVMQNGPVTAVVAKTFNEIVMDPSKDVLINLYREDCPYCQALAPTWEKLGEVYKKQHISNQFIVASVDAMKNELEDQHKPMFVPSIKLYKAGDKANPVFYNGNRSIQDLIQFVKDHSTNGIDGNAAVSPEEPVVDHQPAIHGQSPMKYAHDEL